ncbi:hypothetical protein ACFL3S_13020, partial [Gemmatimonadota bacterium]
RQDRTPVRGWCHPLPHRHVDAIGVRIGMDPLSVDPAENLVFRWNEYSNCAEDPRGIDVDNNRTIEYQEEPTTAGEAQYPR